jgi:hypothetical protein
MADLLHKVLRAHQSEPAMFEFVKRQVALLNASRVDLGVFALRFVIQLSGPLGVEPILEGFGAGRSVFDVLEGQFVDEPPAHAAYWQGPQAGLFARSAVAEHPGALSRSERRQLLDLWLQYLRVHHEGMARVESHYILAEVFGG